jgi:hypothetical protein
MMRVFTWKFHDWNIEDSTIFSVESAVLPYLFVEFTFWQIFHKLFGIIFRIFWLIFVRFASGGNKFSLPLFLQPEFYIPRRYRLQFLTVNSYFFDFSWLSPRNCLGVELSLTITIAEFWVQNNLKFLNCKKSQNYTWNWKKN